MSCASKPSSLDNRRLHLVNGDRRLSRLFYCGVNNCTCTSSLARVDLVSRCRPLFLLHSNREVSMMPHTGVRK